MFIRDCATSFMLVLMICANWLIRALTSFQLHTQALGEWSNYPLLNMCLGKSGRKRVILIHVIDTVTYNLPSIPVQQRAAKSKTTTLQLTLICYKFLLTYSLWQMVTQWESHRLPGSSPINTYFSQQKSNLVATCTFLRLKSEVPTRRRELEGAGE